MSPRHSCSPVLSVLALIAALFFVPPFARAAEHEHGHEHEHGNGEEEHTVLHESMEEMGRAIRVINRGLRSDDPAAVKSELLEALQTMQSRAITAKAEIPETVAELPEAERATELATFRSSVAAAIVTMLELERAVLADDWEKARQLYNELREHRTKGHEKFNPDEEH